MSKKQNCFKSNDIFSYNWVWNKSLFFKKMRRKWVSVNTWSTLDMKVAGWKVKCTWLDLEEEEEAISARQWFKWESQHLSLSSYLPCRRCQLPLLVLFQGERCHWPGWPKVPSLVESPSNSQHYHLQQQTSWVVTTFSTSHIFFSITEGSIFTLASKLLKHFILNFNQFTHKLNLVHILMNWPGHGNVINTDL